MLDVVLVSELPGNGNSDSFIHHHWATKKESHFLRFPVNKLDFIDFLYRVVWKSASWAVFTEDKETQIHVQQVWQHHTGVSERKSRNSTQDGDETCGREYFITFILKCSFCLSTDSCSDSWITFKTSMIFCVRVWKISSAVHHTFSNIFLCSD